MVGDEHLYDVMEEKRFHDMIEDTHLQQQAADTKLLRRCLMSTLN
jgi:hypothetical protein